MRRQLADLVLVLVQRMAGDVEPEHLLFAGELSLVGPVRHVGSGGSGCSSSAAKPSPNRPACPLARSRCARWPRFHGRIDRREQLGARAFERIHRAGLDQALDHPPVDGAEIHLLAEIVERRERARPPRAPARSLPPPTAPTFLIAPRPKRIASPSGVKSSRLRSRRAAGP